VLYIRGVPDSLRNRDGCAMPGKPTVSQIARAAGAYKEITGMITASSGISVISQTGQALGELAPAMAIAPADLAGLGASAISALAALGAIAYTRRKDTTATVTANIRRLVDIENQLTELAGELHKLDKRGSEGLQTLRTATEVHIAVSDERMARVQEGLTQALAGLRRAEDRLAALSHSGPAPASGVELVEDLQVAPLLSALVTSLLAIIVHLTGPEASAKPPAANPPVPKPRME
jgi:hypothetical protein